MFCFKTYNFLKLSAFQYSRCLPVFKVAEIHLTSQADLPNQAYKKKYAQKNKKLEQLKQRRKYPLIEVPAKASISDLVKASNTSLDRVLDAFELIQPNLTLSKSTVISDIKLTHAAMGVLGLRCKVMKKNTDEITPKEDRDEYPSEPTTDPSLLSPRPPVVTIMGHIDHGKTTLLDALRHTNVAQGEAGGITQAIGAFSVEISSGKKITFLDTPGHGAFSAMRKRGALATDLVVLVVAADDGVMEQTVESINAIRLANVPTVIAINKCDLEKANPKKVYAELAEHGVVAEEVGGSVQSVLVSALKGKGLDRLVDAILLQAEFLDLSADNNANVEGVVIESQLTPVGATATMIVQKGTLKKGQWLVAGAHMAKVKRMEEHNKQLSETPPGWPVNVLGWKSLPNAGDKILQVKNEARAKEVMNWRNKLKQKEKEMLDLEAVTGKREQIRREYKEIRNTEHHKMRRLYKIKQAVEKSYKKSDDLPEFNMFLKADVDGSLDALLHVVDSYDCSDRCVLHLADCSVGHVKAGDIERAALCKGYIVCFNVEPSEEMSELAKKNGVSIISSEIIYQLISQLKESMSLLLPQEEKIEVIGEATVNGIFKYSEKKTKYSVAGCSVNNGTIYKDKPVRLIRNDEIIYEGPLFSLRSQKDDVTSISSGKDCGIILAGDCLPQEGDLIQSSETRLVDATLNWNPPGF